MRELAGKLGVVTGAASGIGRALSQQLAEAGCDLALVDVNAAGLRETAERVQAAGHKLSVHEVDVSDRDQMQALPSRVIEEHDRIDLLVNNAGIVAGYSFQEIPIEVFERIMAVNFAGVAYGCKFFLPHLLDRPEARIVNISSMYGFVGVPTNAAYCSSKFAVRGLSEVLWAELSKTNVGVTCVHPGGVRTNIIRSAPGWWHGTEKTQQIFERSVSRTAEQAARRIVRGIRRGERRVRVGWESYLADWAARLIPTVARFLPFDRDPASRPARERDGAPPAH